jgi:hypothetical protein
MHCHGLSPAQPVGQSLMVGIYLFFMDLELVQTRLVESWNPCCIQLTWLGTWFDTCFGRFFINKFQVLLLQPLFCTSRISPKMEWTESFF